jgi:catenin alpha
MLSAVEEVRVTGEAMSNTAREFANDPCSSVKRGNMVRASRNLLSAVTRLLILADMIDVHLLLKKLRRVEDDLEFLRNVSSQAGLDIKNPPKKTHLKKKLKMFFLVMKIIQFFLFETDFL